MPSFQGVMAAKKTADLIPFCHSIPLDGCEITMELKGGDIIVDCVATTDQKTGVEMEVCVG